MKKTKLPLILLGILLVVGALALVLTFVISPATHEDTPTSQTTAAPTPDSTTSTAVSTTPPPPVTMSEAEKQAELDRIEKLHEEEGILYAYKQALLQGKIQPLENRLTVQDIKEQLALGTKPLKDYLRQAQLYPDVVYYAAHSEATGAEYWLDDDGTEIIYTGLTTNGRYTYIHHCQKTGDTYQIVEVIYE